MDSIQYHYDTLLAEAYTWMFGGFEARAQANAALFERLNLQPSSSGLAIDIGCGSGFQSVPLLQRGFSVDAVDVSNVLTDELRRNAAHAPKLNVRVMDGLDYLQSTSAGPLADVLVCMGDTLVHFPSRDYVRDFLGAARARLAVGGTLILTVRDYTRTLHGGDCVIPIRLTDTRILTCVLDYADDIIRVTDMLYERDASGAWAARKNTYNKLRLLPAEISAALVSAGFTLHEQSSVNGLVTFVGVAGSITRSVAPQCDEKSDTSRTGVRHSQPHSQHLGWYSHRYLPHFDSPHVIQGITYRLADSLPRIAIEKMEAELASTIKDDDKRKVALRQRIDEYIDAGHGSCLLRVPEIAECIVDTWQHFDGDRYRLLAWVVMPNHCHVLIEPIPGSPLGKIVLSWKNYTARFINNYKSRMGIPIDTESSHVWQPDYWDRFIRDERHFHATRNYIEMNPVKAGLVKTPEQWQWSSASVARSVAPQCNE